MADRGMIRNETLTPQDSLAANGRSFHWASRFLGARMGRMPPGSMRSADFLMTWRMTTFQMAPLASPASRQICWQVVRVMIRPLPPFALS